MKTLNDIKDTKEFKIALEKLAINIVPTLRAVGSKVQQFGNSELGNLLNGWKRHAMIGSGAALGAAGLGMDGSDIAKAGLGGLAGSALHGSLGIKKILPNAPARTWGAVGAGTYGANKFLLEPYNDKLKQGILDKSNANSSINPATSPLPAAHNGLDAIGAKANEASSWVGNKWNSMSPNARMGIGVGGASLATLLLASMMMRNRNKNEQDGD